MAESCLGVAIVGCGFVADYYMQSLPLYRNLRLIAVMDRDAARAAVFARYYSLDCVRDRLDDVLADARVDMILNLTNPDSHYAVSKSSLEAGKHVYSEKPFAMRLDEAVELTSLAAAKRLRFASAPCSLLGETAQTLWKAVREERVGPIKLVYAEMDDGMVHRMPYRQWYSNSGRQWPYKDEFEVGCTLEHAGYYTTWLTALFGPVVSVTAFSSCLYADKGTDVPLERETPDFSVACLRFGSGVVARLTCSIVAPRNQDLRLFGEHGILSVDDSWNYREPVHVRKMFNVRRKMIITPWRRRVPRVEMPGKRPRPRNPTTEMEFCRGPAELASAILEQRDPALPADFCLHNNEIVLAIQSATEHSTTHRMTTTFAPLRPPSWAR